MIDDTVATSDFTSSAPEAPAPKHDPRRRRTVGWMRLRLPFSPWHLVLIPLSFLLVVPLVWMLDHVTADDG